MLTDHLLWPLDGLVVLSKVLSPALYLKIQLILPGSSDKEDLLKTTEVPDNYSMIHVDFMKNYIKFSC